MTSSPEKIFIDELIRDEGLRLKPYKDSVGKVTIGIGRNLTDVGISQDEARLLLTNDIQKCVDLLDKALPWWRKLSLTRQRVLANMGFNMGVQTLCTFKTFLGLVQAGEYKQAAQDMLSTKWASQVNQRAVRLSSMMETGIDPYESNGVSK